MLLSNANKALLITILLSSTVVLMAFNVHISKKNALIAETYFDILPEEEFFEEVETLEEILESFNELTTNKAFNENKTNEDFEDEEFNEMMEKLNARHEDNTALEEKEVDAIEPANTDAFDEINDLIKKQQNKDSSDKNSSISYSLVDRTKINIPPPIYLCEESGKIVISIVVNAQGKVIETNYNNSSTSINGCLVDHALEYAKASTFTPNNSKARQLGTITFIFKGKR